MVSSHKFHWVGKNKKLLIIILSIIPYVNCSGGSKTVLFVDHRKTERTQDNISEVSGSEINL